MLYPYVSLWLQSLNLRLHTSWKAVRAGDSRRFKISNTVR